MSQDLLLCCRSCASLLCVCVSVELRNVVGGGGCTNLGASCKDNCSCVPTNMLTSRSGSTVTDVDSKPSPEYHDEKPSKKRGRFVSRLFQVSRSSSSSHAKKMSSSSSSSNSRPESTSSPAASSAATTPYSRSTSEQQPAYKRVLLDVPVADSAEMQQQPELVFVTSSPADSWKEEMAKLTRSIAQQHSSNGDGINHEDEWKAARNLASSVIRAWVVRPGAGTQSTVIPGPESFAERNKRDCLSCPKCGGVLYQVVSLACGHSFCRKCATALDHCYKCNRADNPAGQPDQLKTNVTVSTLVAKWWANELTAVELRNLGNQDFSSQQYDQALDKYNQAAQSGNSV